MEEMPGAIILVGNKTDLPEEEGTSYQREVSRETGETFAKVQLSASVSLNILSNNPLHVIMVCAIVTPAI